VPPRGHRCPKTPKRSAAVAPSLAVLHGLGQPGPPTSTRVTLQDPRTNSLWRVSVHRINILYTDYRLDNFQSSA
jgi:hypothetical protein